ncbi:hypothetical protein [Clostridium cellulovorans]|uniref:MotA/TolQ/ExbB proton channel domain-containing protein n=1 Tax=Clostridium cellulovorans (strain ATCC 35296 / DSM 3052 / OCM 3 / 743B) TaxID=573061 RepID=D9SUF2_CLOC7|nr:hypothetical protein [Clostridium cellulovorans]ADL52907.1 hypothetical protein Clocel_3221 [Clostridium cellulovorans 743B]
MNNISFETVTTDKQILSNVDLSNIDLSNVDLSKIDPSKIDLSKIDPSKLDMSKIDTSKLNLDGAGSEIITATTVDTSSITTQLVKSFQEQNEVGFAVIIMTLIVFILGILMLRSVWSYFNGLSTRFKEATKNVNSQELYEIEFKDSEVRSIVKEFKRSAKAGIENVNTEVIISKNIKGRMYLFEEFVKIIPSVATGLGLLGTFLGLTLAIAQTKNSLAGVSSIVSFTIKLQQPIASMASAFWTSIVGVVVSLTMNALIVNMRKSKDEYYDLLEDYLDNVIIVEGSRKSKSISEELVASLEKTFNDMAEKISTSIKEGIKNSRDGGLGSKITEDEFLSYTDELNSIVLSINSNLSNISAPIEEFKNVISNFALISEDLNTRFDNSVTRLVDNISGLDENLGGIQNTIENNNSYIKNIEETLKVQSKNLTNSYQGLTEGVDILKSATMKQLESIKQIGETLKGSLAQLMNSTAKNNGDIEVNQSKELTEAVKELDMTLNAIKNATNELAKNSLIVGQMVKGTNQWLQTIDKDEIAQDYLERK